MAEHFTEHFTLAVVHRRMKSGGELTVEIHDADRRWTTAGVFAGPFVLLVNGERTQNRFEPGETVLVRFNPEDQFAHYVDPVDVEALFNASRAVFADDDAQSPDTDIVDVRKLAALKGAVGGLRG